MAKLHRLPEIALIDMGDFVGGTLNYLRAHPVPRVTLAGGFGKLAKLASGALDLHSKSSQVDVARLAAMLAELGASPELVERARSAAGAGEALALAREAALPLADLVAQRARATVLAALAGEIAVDVVVFARDGALLGRAGP